MDSARFDRLTVALASRPVTRRRALAAGTTLLSGLASSLRGGRAQPATPSTTPTAPATAGLAANNASLFVQTATGGTFQPNPAGSATPATVGRGTPAATQPHGAYLLTLHGHSGETIGFSDRPQRNFGEVKTSRFLQSMGFTPANPPNAALVVDTPQQADAVVLLELMTPAYDSGTQTLIYEANLLHQYPNQRGSALAPLASTVQRATPAATFGSASLFIDDCPDGSITCTDPYTGDVVGTVPVGYCWSWSLACCAPCCPTCSLQAACDNAFGTACTYGSQTISCNATLNIPEFGCS